MSTTADKVRAAADHIEKYGLHKGSMYAEVRFRHRDELSQVAAQGIPCCTVGALHAFGVNEAPVREAVARAAGPEVWDDYNQVDEIPIWNDADKRTADEVVAALRKAADKLEADRV